MSIKKYNEEFLKDPQEHPAWNSFEQETSRWDLNIIPLRPAWAFYRTGWDASGAALDKACADLNAMMAKAAPPLHVPPDWPYGPPDHHEACCVLHRGATFCDCKASDASDSEFGLGHAGVRGDCTHPQVDRGDEFSPDRCLACHAPVYPPR